MPAPRAVLADILQFNLDPTVHHRTTHASGRLSKPIGEVIVVEPVVAPPVPEAIVIEPEPAVQVEPIVDENEKAPEESTPEADVTTGEAPKKKKGRFGQNQ